MKVKLGMTIYEASEQPIMVILSDADKQNIADMEKEAHCYCEFPDTMTEDEIQTWMKAVEK